MWLVEWLCRAILGNIIMDDFVVMFGDNKVGTSDAKWKVRISAPWLFIWNLLAKGETGFGESYRDGHWSLTENDLGDFLVTIAKNSRESWFQMIRYLLPPYWLNRWNFNWANKSKTDDKHAVQVSYDTNERMCEVMLDQQYHMYTCARFLNPNDNLLTAQINKLDLLFSPIKANIKGDGSDVRLLDIGCGWGGLMKYAAERYQCIQCVGITNSPGMAASINSKFNNPRINAFETDFRDWTSEQPFDVVTSLGMVEHIGVQNYDAYAETISRSLKPGGRAVIQTINAREWNNLSVRTKNILPHDSFVMHYIFPCSQIPNLDWIHESFSKDFKHLHTETFGRDYGLTTRFWRLNLREYQNEHHDLPEDEVRKFEYYLAWCEAAFLNEFLHLSQLVFEKK